MDMDIIEFGNRVRDIRRNSDWRVLRTIIDNDSNRQSLLLKNCSSITSEMARKGPGSIADGLNMIQQLLRNTSEGRPRKACVSTKDCVRAFVLMRSWYAITSLWIP